MGWGDTRLTAAQRRAFIDAVCGKVVIDLGSGVVPCRWPLGGSEALFRFDRNGRYQRVRLDEGVARADFETPTGRELVWKAACHGSGRPALALLSWPDTDPEFSWSVLHPFSTVLYIGHNLGDTACGNERLFRHLLTRPAPVIEPGPEQTLIVYGPSTFDMTYWPRCAEEFAGVGIDAKP